MNKLLTLILMLLVSTQLKAQSAKTFSLEFNKDNFVFKANPNGYLEISTSKYVYAFDNENEAPALPYIPISIKIPYGKTVQNFNFSSTQSIISHNNVLASNPIQGPTNSIPILTNSVTSKYKETYYPKENIIFTGTNNIDGFTIANFLVCPFKYETLENDLYITDKISVNIIFADKQPNTQQYNCGLNRQNLDINNTIINPLHISENSQQSSTNRTIEAVDSIDYVIITNSYLAEAFNDIASWKMIKGIRTKIITIDEIKELCPNTCTQYSIKDYLFNCYKNNGLKYVLLGGDDTIVPTLGCYAYYNKDLNYTDMPTDMFYACFDNDFYWDANKNGIHGEYDDNISMYPNIYVTRLPVRTSSDVETYSYKLLQYEKKPNKWKKEILMAGNSLIGGKDTICSDAERKGDNLYNNYISKLWDGKRVKFYDTGTDFSGGAQYQLNIEHFQDQLQQGFPFVNMITHGHPYAWKLENNLLYTTKYSNLLQNITTGTIITTNACLTNAFDHYVDWEGKINDPCLSESFIRNKNSGIIAYFGSSREGIDTFGSSDFGTSSKYTMEFYKALFSQTIEIKNFGVIATAAKLPYATISERNQYYRFVQFGLNPIGDPEMPIYTDNPIEISRCRVNFGIPNKLTVFLGEKGCTICASSKEGSKRKYYRVVKNTNQAVFQNVNTDLTICITKQNYIPKIIDFKYPTGKNSIIQYSNDGNILSVVTQLEEKTREAKLKISSTNGHEERIINIDKNNAECQENISDLQKGIHHISLYVNGKLVDSINFIKK